MTDHNSGAKDQAEEGGAAGGAAANVVPFPRTWYGSVDELVPIDLEPPRNGRQSDPAGDASAFWGGETAQTGVARGPTAEGSDATHVAQDAVTDRHDDELEFSRGTPADIDEKASAGGALARDLPTTAYERRWKSPRRLPTVFVLVVIGLLVGVLSLAALNGGGPKHDGAVSAARNRDLTVTQTVPRTTTVVQTVTTGRRGPVRHRHEQHTKPTRVITARSATTTAPAISYHPSTPPSPSSSSSNGTSIRSVGSGRTSPPSGSSKTRCAPSITNGGACSL